MWAGSCTKPAGSALKAPLAGSFRSVSVSVVNYLVTRVHKEQPKIQRCPAGTSPHLPCPTFTYCTSPLRGICCGSHFVLQSQARPRQHAAKMLPYIYPLRITRTRQTVQEHHSKKFCTSPPSGTETHVILALSAVRCEIWHPTPGIASRTAPRILSSFDSISLASPN